MHKELRRCNRSAVDFFGEVAYFDYYIVSQLFFCSVAVKYKQISITIGRHVPE